MQEPENHVDRCAVAAVKITTEGCLSKLQKVVGHVPLEISRHLFFALGYGCKVKGEVLDAAHFRSPLTHGGLEVKCRIILEWADKDKFFFLKRFIDNYSFEKRNVDDSEAILKEITEGMKCIHIPELESDADSDNEELN